ncbi:MAG: TIGR03620 family F420-dependent LLM class oxidoreductase [Acetobacteraceae bacterium]|nr:TIGR03620 family F420-dependent LLM class oxidoreductase [Acetobacteraceae bacterium]
MKLGRLAAWYGLDRLDGPGIKAFLPLLERLGYDTLWHPESRGYETFALDSFLLSNSTKLKIGSSITSIYARDAFAARRGMITLNSLYGDRYILGLGVSHIPMVEGMRGHVYEKPIPAMRRYLDGICKDQPDSDSWPVMIAALRPRMLGVAGEKTRGALPYNATPEHTASARKILGPDKWLVAEQKVSLETDPVTARAVGRKELERYLTLPNYCNHWLASGFTQADLDNGGSDRFIDAMMIWGDVATVKRKLRAHLDAGATQLAIQPIHPDGDYAERDRILTVVADI